ncbi:MAG: DUF1624 domain-containing protein [Kiritimatiellae bacterium]|nr:DUF1624 domain-containing protein [Kiritimatiellia bacterium]
MIETPPGDASTDAGPGGFQGTERGSQAEVGSRLVCLDALRGLIVVLMALDHANYFVAKVHPGEFWGLPLPEYSSIPAFLTRFVSHICAPGFFFLMGVGIILFAESRRKKGWPNAQITRLLLRRGFVLIGCQFLLENPAWLFGLVGGHMQATGAPGGGGMPFLYFGVLFCLGASMVFWALLRRLRPAVCIAISVGAVLITQFLTPGSGQVDHLFSPPVRVLLVPGQTGIVQVYYPLIPWFGVTGLGLAFGKIIVRDRRLAVRLAFAGGVVFLLMFSALRLAGRFGNLHPPGTGWIGFLNVTKYPPSLVMVLLTLGLCLILLALFARVGQGALSPLLTFGRTPFFFYVAHLYLYGVAGLAFPRWASLAVLYLVWMGGLVLLYPFCRWYGVFKRSKPATSPWRSF